MKVILAMLVLFFMGFFWGFVTCSFTCPDDGYRCGRKAGNFIYKAI